MRLNAIIRMGELITAPGDTIYKTIFYLENKTGKYFRQFE